jgi:pimeloyl-ACP methyl ester carboxylesterase
MYGRHGSEPLLHPCHTWQYAQGKAESARCRCRPRPSSHGGTKAISPPRGQAGYEHYRRDFARRIWRLASPQWAFEAATFARSAAAFDHPEHVRIVMHHYRWRLSLAEGEPPDDALAQRLAQGPVVAVPTITLEGDANGAPHPDASAYAKKFSGAYAHRVITGGIGHNLPQAAPQAFAEAVLDVDGY